MFNITYYPKFKTKAYYTLGSILKYLNIGNESHIENLLRFKDNFILNNLLIASGGCYADWTLNSASAIRSKYQIKHRDGLVGFEYHWDKELLVRFDFIDQTMYVRRPGNVILGINFFDTYHKTNPIFLEVMNRFYSYYIRQEEEIIKNNPI